MSSRLCVAAYRWGSGRDREAAVVTLRSLRPDVVVLHRVPGHPFAGHRIAAFADHLDLMWSGGPHRRSGGTTVLTSLRLDALDERHLSLGSSGHSGYAVTRLRLPGHPPCRVVGAHLAEPAGSAQLAELRAAVEGGGEPVVALSCTAGAAVMADGWPGFAGAVVPVTDEVTSTVVDLGTTLAT
ncbi:MAG TPA: hypothetical protein VFJ12_07010 [Segeticoccus sp.]|nr:hypothetical protein [Segeticoccus sp.]